MTNDFSSARILVLDDLPANTALVVRILDWAGFSNVMALNDQEQLEDSLNKFDPDVLILDLHMPGRTGHAILKSLRESTRWASLPVLVFTADITPAAKAQAFEAGATDFLTKPGEAVEVTMRVTSAVRTSFLQRKLRTDAQRLGQGLLAERKQMSEVEESYMDRLTTIAALRSPMDAAFSSRLAPAAANFARQLGEEDLADKLEQAVLVRSIGAVGVSDEAIQQSNNPAIEQSAIRDPQSSIVNRQSSIPTSSNHQESSAAKQIFQDPTSDLLRIAAEVATNRYERWDGSGPNHLSGEDLPLSSRIVAIAEVFTQATDQAAPNPIEAVLREAGRHLDPNLTAKFEELNATTPLLVFPAA